MPISPKPTGSPTAALDAVVAAVGGNCSEIRTVGAGEPDTSDDVMVAAMTGLVDAMKADGARLGALGFWIARARRQAAVWD